MHVDRHSVVAAQPLGEPQVIAVAVREHDALDVLERSAHRPELGRQIAPMAGQAGVDHRDPVGSVDQVGRDDVVADAVQVRGELHESSHRRNAFRTYGYDI